MERFPSLQHVSECFLKPKFQPLDQIQPYYLGPGDLTMLSAQYIQHGLLFIKPLPTHNKNNHQQLAFSTFLQSLKDSFSMALVHFYPLAGQLATQIDHDHHTSLIFVDTDKGPGARFTHATLDMTTEDVLSPTAADDPHLAQALFDHCGAVNYDGHDKSLLSVQVTELLDGIFIACSMNHVVADGTSYWHFWNTWSKIHTTQSITISNPPIHKRWVPEAWGGLPVTLPFTWPEEFISRCELPPLRKRDFHFSSEWISKLKSRANEELGENILKISSLQALSAWVWRTVTRARSLAGDKMTGCALVASTRDRILPPLPQGYFGNSIWVAKAAVPAGELLEHDLGWAALLLHRAVSELTDETVRSVYEEWKKSPFMYPVRTSFCPNALVFGHSPRFDVYGNDFGLGKPIAVRGGKAKFPGRLAVYPGSEGGGSMDIEICLSPDSMRALESDDEFMRACSIDGNRELKYNHPLKLKSLDVHNLVK